VVQTGRRFDLLRRSGTRLPVSFLQVPDAAAVRMAYEVLLDRQPDESGLANFTGFLARGGTRRQMVADMLASEEFRRRIAFPPEAFGPSIHAGRSEFIRTLPKARRIVDLGGTALASESGAMVAMGYPYDFEELTIVDLPVEDRHALYQDSVLPDRVMTPNGPVTYRYHSMVDLSGIPDGAIDLVYSGQSIEHVTVDDATTVVAEVARILGDRGWFALDTPNSRVTRLQQEAFIDPDHEHEYDLPELVALVGSHFEVQVAYGLNYCGDSVRTGVFDLAEAAANVGLHGAADECYIICLLCRKLPGPLPGPPA
jgi:hypothetical protein